MLRAHALDERASADAVRVYLNVGIEGKTSCILSTTRLTRSRCNMQMPRWERNTIRLTFLGALMACGADAAPPPPPHLIVADVIIAVANRTSREQRIYLQSGTTEHALGTVAANSSRSFSVPSSAGDSTNELRLEARELSAKIRSEAFLLTSGKRVTWTIDKPGHGLLVMR